MREVLLGIDGIGHLSQIVVLVTAPSPSVIGREEEVLVEVGRGLEAQSRAPSVDIVVREDGVDGTDVDIVGRTGLNGVLEERLESEDDILHALDVLDAVNELVHGALALGQLDLPVLSPELVVTHLGISLGELFGLALEEFLGYGVKAIVKLAKLRSVVMSSLVSTH